MGELFIVNKSIKEIEKILEENEIISDAVLKEIKNDERKGVKKALAKYMKNEEKKLLLEQQFETMTKYESQLRMRGVSLIAGVDEVGRGPIAGPVVAAAVILPEGFKLLGLTDSKKVNKKKRDYFFEKINQEAISVGIGVVSANEIDRINIYEATKVAMTEAISKLTIAPEHLLIDAMQLASPIEQTAIIKGDSKSISIAASSIVAKVWRDRYMTRLSSNYPQYGFEKHMGYGTEEHLIAIDKHGICDEHRKSFAPVRDRCFVNTLF